jgi:hypothetical protein
MLDAATSTQDASASARRRVHADDARAAVVRFLATDAGTTALELAEREELTAELRSLDARMGSGS